ncbi:lipopolysaccharide biosynthesis protein [Luteibacter yeojuensis]|nr:lipopolysaccharide biosynthesis protein [Luteibacter yeojuensis]
MQTTAMLVVRLVTQAANLVLLTRWMGPAIYGQYTAVASLAVVASLIPSLGAGFVLMAREAREPGTGADVVRYAWPLALLLGFLLCILFPLVATHIGGNALSAAAIFTIGATELLVAPLLMICNAALQAQHRAARGQVVQWLPLGVRLIVTLGCYMGIVDASLGVFVLLQAVGGAVGLATGIAVTWGTTHTPWRPRLPTRGELTSGATYAAMNVVAANPSELDKVLAIRLLGDHAAGIYSATARVLNAVITPVMGMLLAAQQSLFRHGANPAVRGTRLIRTIALASAAWGVVSAVALAVCAPLLPHFLGPRFDEAASVMPWVCAAAPFMALRLAAGTVLVALGKPMHRMAFELAGIAVLVMLLGIGAHVAAARGMALGLAGAEAVMAATGWAIVMQAHRRLTALTGGDQRPAMPSHDPA